MTGVDSLREAGAASSRPGSFWFAAAAMAAAVATITELRDGTGLQDMKAAGQQLRAGLQAQAQAHGLAVHQTGPVQMPFLPVRGRRLVRSGQPLVRRDDHPRRAPPPLAHNWFLSAAHTSEDIDEVLSVTDRSFSVVAAGA